MTFFDHFAKTDVTALGALIEFKTKENEFNYIAKFLNSGSEILEIGAGQGILANIFSNNNFIHYDIVEPNDIMQNNLIQGGCVRHAKNYFIPGLLEEDSSYDLIILTHLFQHLNDCNEAKKCISEVRRVLKPNGLIFLVSPDYNDWKKDFHDCDFTHNYITTLRHVKELFLGEDIEIIGHKHTYACFESLSGYLISKIIKIATF